MDEIIPLAQPLTQYEMRVHHAERGYVEGVVKVELSEVIARNFEGFLDLLSERLVGSSLLMDIQYDVVGHADDTLHIRVDGDASECIEEIGE